jgi:tetraacyldisaccharide 4'-kinase
VNPLSAIYGAVSATRNRLYDRQFLRTHRLRGPVISVGNLSVGGSGKTPFVLLLGEQLKKRRIAFDILSRGYRRETDGVALVDPRGAVSSFGDEPLLLARKLQAPVILGESRFQAGLFAERKFGPQVHLLDDGFQHRSLARDFDIVLLPIQDLSDRLLPSGRLREPLASLRRADAVVLAEDATAPPDLDSETVVWRVRRGIRIDPISGPQIAFCGIARPDVFFAQLRATGVEVAAEVAFRDHHRYTTTDAQHLRELQRRHRARGFVSTEKDAVNLGPLAAELEPLSIAQVTMELQSPADAVDTMLRILAERKRRA